MLMATAADLDGDTLAGRLAGVTGGSGRQAFDAQSLGFLKALSRDIRTDPAASALADLRAFGFWCRPAAMPGLRGHLDWGAPPDSVTLPRGVVFHLPPANVPTLFAYSWVLALLAGNRNIVRLPGRLAPSAQVLLRLIERSLEDFPALRDQQLFLSYDHDDAITSLLSARCDLRVVWGGDATIARIRALPLPPLAAELCFADRFSMAAFRAAAVLDLGDDAVRRLAGRFHDDLFTFGQQACSSPHLAVWVGAADHCQAASARLYRAVAAIEGAGGQDAATMVARMSQHSRAIIDHPVRALTPFGPHLVVLTLDRFADLRADPGGGGTLFEWHVADLQALLPHLRRKDQTLTHMGFSPDDLSRLAQGGFDRLVPVGQALAFDVLWDGQDLLRAFSRSVTLRYAGEGGDDDGR
jgi:hypothetical protein